MKKRVLPLAWALTLAVGLIGCGSARTDSQSAYTESGSADYADYAYEEAAYDEYYESDSMTAYSESNGTDSINTTENASTSNRKLIRNVSLDVETKEFEALTTNLYQSIEDNGGYIESLDLYNGSTYSTSYDTRSAYIVARIPADRLNAFVNTIGEAANITNRSESVEDVTLNYVDMTSHRDMLEEEQERLLAFLEEAQDVEEIISLEDRLTEVRYELESMESQIRTYDNLVDYSTVKINVEEVYEYTPEPEPEPQTVGERIKAGFSESLKDVGEGLTDFFVNFIIALPYIILILIIIAIFGLIIFLIIRAADKHAAKRREKGNAAKADATLTQGKEEAAQADDKVKTQDNEAAEGSSPYVARPNKSNGPKE